HRAEHDHAIAVPGDLGEVFADLQAGGLGGDFLERAAVDVAGLEVERVHLRGAAVHPQQDHLLLAVDVGGGGVGEPAEPARDAGAQNAGGGQFQQVTTRQDRCSHVNAPLK